MDGREPGNMVMGPNPGATNSSIATENWTGMMHELQISYSSMCTFKQVDVAGALYQGDDLAGNAYLMVIGDSQVMFVTSTKGIYNPKSDYLGSVKFLSIPELTKGTSGIVFTRAISVEVGEDFQSKDPGRSCSISKWHRFWCNTSPASNMWWNSYLKAICVACCECSCRDITRSSLDRVLFCSQKIMELGSEAVMKEFAITVAIIL